MSNYKAVIIGSGIAGMTAAIYLKRAGINTLIIESDVPGGQLNKSSIIENYPGFEKIDGPSLALNIYNQVNALKVDYLFSKVKKVDFKKKQIVTEKEEVSYEYLIIATGRSPQKLGLENEEKLIGNGISYCALCDGALYKDKRVVVIGRGNSALEEALYLANISKRVILINHKDLFKAEEKLINEVYENDNIEIIYNSNIVKFNSKDNKLTSVILDNKQEIKCDGLFVDIGYLPNSEIFNVEKVHGYIEVDEEYKTSRKNVYACGDIIYKNTYQLTTAVGEATNVAASIIKSIEKRK